MWEGSISCSTSDDKFFLESLGVIVGCFDEEHNEFVGCVVSNEALDKLDPYWGRFVWSLN